MKTHTKLPWSACNKGACSCKQIWGNDHPVAVVTSGEWGDEYPSIRIEERGSFHEVAVPYMEKIVYGEVSAETAEANAALIVRAVNCHEQLVEALKAALEWIDAIPSRNCRTRPGFDRDMVNDLLAAAKEEI